MWHFVHGLLLKPLPSSSVAFHSVSPVSSSVVSFFPVFFHFCRQPFCPFSLLFCNAPVSPHASHHNAQRMCTSHTAHLAPSSDKAPSSKPHIYNMPRERGCFVFFLSLSFPFSQRMSAVPVAQQHAFGTSCVEAINSRASFLFCFRRNCFTISSCTIYYYSKICGLSGNLMLHLMGPVSRSRFLSLHSEVFETMNCSP